MLVILKVWQVLPQEGFLWVYVLFLKYLHLFSPKNSAETNIEERQYIKSNRQQQSIFVTSVSKQSGKYSKELSLSVIWIGISLLHYQHPTKFNQAYLKSIKKRPRTRPNVKTMCIWTPYFWLSKQKLSNSAFLQLLRLKQILKYLSNTFFFKKRWNDDSGIHHLQSVLDINSSCCQSRELNSSVNLRLTLFKRVYPLQSFKPFLLFLLNCQKYLQFLHRRYQCHRVMTFLYEN